MHRIQILLITFLLAPLSLHAQQSVQPSTAKLSATTFPVLLATFLADSGVATRGLSWGVAGNIPVKWTTTKPTKPTWDVGPGINLQHEGQVRVEVADTTILDMTLVVYGNSAGIQRVGVSWDMNELPGERAEGLLTSAGWLLKPLKCTRAAEGYSFGNLLFAAKAPGKTGSGLLENWNCAHDGCTATMTIYYRKADVPQIDCVGT
ncbi:MAG: hypothetical protein E4H41_05905 [Gemmatimonadales bacterium]|jgi:hypothetical protein|nr:MAG: hypothetical protein E4H41_05905 [Gemmatimonadales bacterium]